jgi:uncharacterized membrane protein (UPF0182 family)
VFGNLLLIPVDESLLYIRPMYTQAESGTQVPRLQRVIVEYAGEVVIERTLRESLVEIFGDAPETQEEIPVEGDEQPDEPADPAEEEEPSEGDADVAQLLADADAALQAAEEALADGDLGTYQEKVDEARRLVDDALQLSGGGTTTTTSEPSDSA